MKQRIVFCLLLAFSAAAHGFSCEQELGLFLIGDQAFIDPDNCKPPSVFPPAHVTTPTKDTARVDPKSYLVDENIFTFELAPAPAQLTSKAITAGQGIGASDATADRSGRYLYVATNGTNDISAYMVDPASGQLSNSPGAPFKTGKNPHALVVHPSNQFLYSADFSGNTISAFRIDPASGTLIAIGTVAAAALPGSMAIHPSGQFLYVTSTVRPGMAVVQTYAIDTNSGALSALGSPISTAGIPLSIVMDPLGQYLYFITSNGFTVTNSIEAYAVGAAGALTKVPGSPFPLPFSSFGQLAADPGGRFIYALNPMVKSVSVFAIERSAGALSSVAGSPFATGPNPTFMVPGPSGRYLLVADPGSLRNNGTDAIWIYAVNAVTGALAPIAGSPFATQGPNTPDVVAVNQVSPKGFAKLGNAYSNTNFQVNGGQPPYVWSISSATLPPGLALNATTGQISGVPAKEGTFDFTVRVTDATGLGASLAYFIKVDTCVLPSCPGYVAGAVVEFYNAGLDNFFITGNAAEQTAVADGAAGAGWSTTGDFLREIGRAHV